MRVSLFLRAITAVTVPTVLGTFIGHDLLPAAAASRSSAPAVVAANRPVVTPPPAVIPPVLVATVSTTPLAPPTRPTSTTPPPVPVPFSARRVVLYGDSLGWEAQSSFHFTLGSAGFTQVTTRTFGGTAICDWLAQMRADETALHPDAVVVEFSGNAIGRCMWGLDGSPLSTSAYFAKYQHDARAVLDIFTRTATVYLVGTPISQRAALADDPNTGRLNTIYQTLAATTAHTRYIDAGAAVTAEGHWTHTLPCLATEPCSGGTDAAGTHVNVVRAPDGAHFCPVAHAAIRGVVESCPVYSSGAYRFGAAMAEPVIADFSGETRG